MKRRFLDFVELAPRSQKPRVTGLSTFGDRGYPLEWIRGMLDAYGDCIDLVKFTPTCLLVPWDDIEKRYSNDISATAVAHILQVFEIKSPGRSFKLEDFADLSFLLRTRQNLQ